jgi:hypothetical protein
MIFGSSTFRTSPYGREKNNSRYFKELEEKYIEKIRKM